MADPDHGTFSVPAAVPAPPSSESAGSAPEGVEAVGRGAMQPPVAYLPCRLDDDGGLDQVLLVELVDGRVALLGYTALDRFVAACGDAHPWVLWRTERLPELRALRPYDVAYLDVALPEAMRRDSAESAEVRA